jgi:DNA-binding NarL/FixJ family response regulator
MKKVASKQDSTVTVAIVEDNAGVRRNLQQFIDEAPGFRCLCACDSGEQALKLIPPQPPDVVLMDLHLPGCSGIEATSRLKELLPDLQVIILTVYDDVDRVFKALRAGACGYLLKRSPPEQILAAITEVRGGGAPMTSEIARKLVEAFQEPPHAPEAQGGLTHRQEEILELLCRGLANKEIAASLSISYDTVRWHLKEIFQKLHVRCRTEAAQKFRAGHEAAAGLPGPPASHLGR